jgi:hypothetical protein
LLGVRRVDAFQVMRAQARDGSHHDRHGVSLLREAGD